MEVRDSVLYDNGCYIVYLVDPLVVSFGFRCSHTGTRLSAPVSLQVLSLLVMTKDHFYDTIFYYRVGEHKHVPNPKLYNEARGLYENTFREHDEE